MVYPTGPNLFLPKGHYWDVGQALKTQEDPWLQNVCAARFFEIRSPVLVVHEVIQDFEVDLDNGRELPILDGVQYFTRPW